MSQSIDIRGSGDESGAFALWVSTYGIFRSLWGREPILLNLLKFPGALRDEDLRSSSIENFLSPPLP